MQLDFDPGVKTPGYFQRFLRNHVALEALNKNLGVIVYPLTGLNDHSLDSVVCLIMNAKPLLFCLFSASTAFAGDPPAQYNAKAFPAVPLYSHSQSSVWLTKKTESPLVTLAKTDFTVTGPLIDGLRPLGHSADLSPGRKFLRLPIIRLFVPGPMPSPPGTGKYFAWRASDNDEPWEARSSRPCIVKGP